MALKVLLWIGALLPTFGLAAVAYIRFPAPTIILLALIMFARIAVAAYRHGTDKMDYPDEKKNGA